MTAPRRSAAPLLGLIALAVLASCARKAPPSGGPPDVDPPRVASAYPDSDAAGVPRDAQPRITFSEGMEPRSTGEAIDLAPRIDVRQRRWSGRTVTIVLADTLRSDQTYTLFVGGTARDRHGNPMGEGRSWVFTTAPTLPPGRIMGVVEARGFEVAGTYLWSYDQSKPPAVPDSTARDFDALGIADRIGAFHVDGLTVPGTYRLWAFADLNRNRSYEPDKDVLAPIETLFVLTAERPVVDSLRLVVTDPRAPGRVRGTVLDSLGMRDSVGVSDSLRVRESDLAVIAVASADSTRHVAGSVDEKSAFDLKLEPGRWTLRGIRDVDHNRRWNPATEPASDTLAIQVAPAGDLKDVVLVLRRRP